MYIGTRFLASWIKVSAHAAGDIRFAVTDRHLQSDNALVTPDRRVIERWRA